MLEHNHFAIQGMIEKCTNFAKQFFDIMEADEQLDNEDDDNDNASESNDLDNASQQPFLNDADNLSVVSVLL